jgi:hypothetical protein
VGGYVSVCIHVRMCAYVSMFVRDHARLSVNCLVVESCIGFRRHEGAGNGIAALGRPLGDVRDIRIHNLLVRAEIDELVL